MDIKSILPEFILALLRNVKKQLHRPLFYPLRNTLGAFTVYPFSYFNNYSSIDKGKSRLPQSFNSFKATPLCYIMKEKGTDKALFQGTSKHNYTTFYYATFRKLLNERVRIFELGIGTTNLSIRHNMGEAGIPGASLRGWQAFFPNAKIFGADIDKTILFKERRIKTFYTDQTKAEVIRSMWEAEELQDSFHIIIDDGLHEFEPNRCFLENSIHKLSKGGLYIIEDIECVYLPQWKQYLPALAHKYNELRFCLIEIPNDFNKWNNNLLVIEKML